jgi:hypothetical protein
MSKLDIHGTAPRYQRERRNFAAIARRLEKRPVRVAKVLKQATALRHCPHCGMGLSARYRTAGTVHLRRNRRPPEVCAWTP